jgi:ParB family chromosome partitioning protein
VTSTIVSYDITEDLPISEIKLPENQLRSHHNLDELVVSISQRGLLHPIIVRTVNGRPLYEVVAGCRRYLACKKIGKRKIACQITDLSDKEAFEVSIIENVQRMTLETMDEATAFKTYVSDKGWGGVSQLAAKLGKSVSYVTKRIMLLDLPKEVRKSIGESTLNPSVAQELIYLQSKEDKSKLAKLIINRRLTTSNVRKMVKEMNDKILDETYIKDSTGGNIKLQRSFDKTIIAIRIAMNRIGNIIDETDDDWIVNEILMQHKRRLHEQIDILINQKKRIV